MNQYDRDDELKIKTNISDTFCALPWIHFATRPNGDVRLCCSANASGVGKYVTKETTYTAGISKMRDGRHANMKYHTVEESWNNDYMKNVRLKMLNGEIPESCTKCFNEESKGVASKRLWETKFWDERIDLNEIVNKTAEDGSVPEELVYLDLRLGHLCNLKCVMCSPHDSSKWIADWQKLFPKLQNPDLKSYLHWDKSADDFNWHENEDFWTSLKKQIPNLKQVYFAGGEPTLIKQHYEFVEEIVRQGYADRIMLRYNSNGVELPHGLLELFGRFKEVKFAVSLDAYGDRNHYIRYPADWNKIEKTLYELDNTPDNIIVTLATAVQILNLPYLPEFIDWKINAGFKKLNPWPMGGGLINMHLLYMPTALCIKILPLETKAQITDQYNSFYDWLKNNYRNDSEFVNHPYGLKRWQAMIDFMNSEDWSHRMPEFKEYITNIDQLRGLDFRKTFPLIQGLLD